MFAVLNQPGRRSLLLNLLAALGAVLAVNGLIFVMAWDQVSATSQAPPGSLVGSVWVVLFVLMATARWQLNAYSAKQAATARNWVTILMLSCLLYPFYALALHSQIGGLLGNVGTIALTIFVVTQAWSISKPTALLMLPVALWVAFATVTVVKDLGWL